MGLELELMQSRTAEVARVAARHTAVLAALHVEGPRVERPRRRLTIWRRRPVAVGCMA
jgi:hypothetical protein